MNVPEVYAEIYLSDDADINPAITFGVITFMPMKMMLGRASRRLVLCLY